MNNKFVFDKKTGTMQPVNAANNVGQKKEKTVSVVPEANSRVANDERFEQLKKRAVELGLDGILLFRSETDYTRCQIVDERTRKVYAYIGGYALDIKFNMEELNTVVKVEQCLEGIKKLFRSFIVEQAIENK